MLVKALKSKKITINLTNNNNDWCHYEAVNYITAITGVKNLSKSERSFGYLYGLITTETVFMVIFIR